MTMVSDCYTSLVNFIHTSHVFSSEMEADFPYPSFSISLVFSHIEIADPSRPKVPTTEGMDDWELKLLGKKGVPFTPSEFKSQRDNLSMISGMSSANSAGGGGGGGGANVGNLSATSSRNNTLERTSRTNTLERPTRLLPQVTFHYLHLQSLAHIPAMPAKRGKSPSF